MMLFKLAALSLLYTASAQSAVSSGRTVNVSDYTRTIRAGWSNSNGQGLFTDGLTQLAGPVGGDTSSTNLYGLLLEFNSTLGEGANSTRSSIPFIALVSCDDTQSALETANSTLTNSTLTNSTSASNTTTPSNGTEPIDVFALGEELGAVAFVLYSTANQSCTLLNSTANSTFPVPIFTLPAASHSRTLIGQFNNVEAGRRYYNATLLVESTSNLTQALSSIAAGVLPQTGFLVAQIQPNATDSTSPVVASIGRAPGTSSSTSRTATASGTGPSGAQSSQPPASGASAMSCGASALTGLAVVAGLWSQVM